MSTDTPEESEMIDQDDADGAESESEGDTKAEGWGDDSTDTDEGSDDGDGDKAEEAETSAALDELEAEELEMLTEDESNEAMVVDEAAEMRAIRRAEIAMESGEVDEAASDEFVCTTCFLVKNVNQLAAKRKKICRDCAI